MADDFPSLEEAQASDDYCAARLAWIMLNEAHRNKYENDSAAALWANLDDEERARYRALWLRSEIT